MTQVSVELVPAKLSHIPSIASRMRDWDRKEAGAFGRDPDLALRMGFVASVDCKTAMVNGHPEAMLGLVPKNVIEGEGQPWMLGTEEVYRHPRAVLTLSRKMVDVWRDSLPTLRNLVGADNVRAIRYLRRLGFEIGKERQVIGGTEFVTFTMERR
jgi:ribosomal protein S18 acetylase RimI-like enzyme